MMTSPRLVLRLLGGFSLERDAAPCAPTYHKGRALLAYLSANAGHEYPRKDLAALLWPNLAHAAALTNLRQVLHDLRRILDPGKDSALPLRIGRETIALDASIDLAIDATSFLAPDETCASAPCPEDCPACIARNEVLAALYRGEFMAGYTLPESPEFEEWLQTRREILHLRALDRLARLADVHERALAHAKALPFALRFHELEPWHEPGICRVMRLFAMIGQPDVALTHFDDFCRALDQELGIYPGAPTLALADRIRGGELPAATPAPVPTTERRQVSVLFCKLTPRANDEPDETLLLLQPPHEHCSKLIRNHGGYLMRTHGSSLLAYFGYPLAGEDAARHAVQAALSITNANAAFAGIDLRVGVHTSVVICDPSTPDATGTATGIASGLRLLAGSGEVAISGNTHRLVNRDFVCHSTGLKSVPGSEHTLEVFRVARVKRENDTDDRLGALDRLTPFVGRRRELAALRNQWQSSCKGQRRYLLLSGEAGIGKSRLVHELKSTVRKQGGIVRELRCSFEHNQSPYAALSTLLGTTLAFSLDDSPDTRIDKLAGYVETHYGKNAAQVLPLLARVLALPLRAPYRESTASAQQQRDQTLALLLDCLPTPTEQPLLLIVEDLHWADPSSIDFFQRWIAQENAAPILTIFIARPTFVPPWPANKVRIMTLARLDDVETSDLIAAVAPQLDPAIIHRLVERADGIPLFAEELARESGDSHSTIPPTLQDLLAARLDSLGPAKTVAQAAACIGRNFGVDLLSRAMSTDEATLAPQLLRLKESGLVNRETSGSLHFRHALMRDAAYESQTRTGRRAIHCRIAIALSAKDDEARPEILAQHWAAGGEILKSVRCWIAAGKLANRHSASQEAIAHFSAGLKLLELLTDNAARLHLELELQIGLGAAAFAVRGYASTESSAAYSRAMALCEQHPGNPELFPSVWGLWASASSRVGYGSALMLAQKLLHMAGLGGDQIHAQQAHFAVANTLYWQGDFITARQHIDWVTCAYQPAHHGRHLDAFGEDAGVTSRAYQSWILWVLGFADQALEASIESVSLARRLKHPFSLGYALTFAALLRCRLRRPEEALALAEETGVLASQYGFPLWRIGALLAHGWALSMQGRPEGVDTIRQCAETVRTAMGGVTMVVLVPMVDACVLTGCFDAAMSAIDEAIATGHALGDHHAEAELLRLKGETLLGQAGASREMDDPAEICFHQSLEISRKQRAKSLGLRAATSLARLWQRQGKDGDARRLIATHYATFTEGLDTPDLQDAHSLLDALAR